MTTRRQRRRNLERRECEQRERYQRAQREKARSRPQPRAQMCLDRSLSQIEQERATARANRQQFGRVVCAETFYVRHLGADDRTAAPISHRSDIHDLPPIIRRHRA